VPVDWLAFALDSLNRTTGCWKRSVILSLKNALALVGGCGKALLQFQAQQRYHQETLLAYEAELAGIEENWGSEVALMNMPIFGDYLTIKRGARYEREFVDWLQWVIVILEERMKQKQEGDRENMKHE
jgi:Virulence activator alpha C-term